MPDELSGCVFVEGPTGCGEDLEGIHYNAIGSREIGRRMCLSILEIAGTTTTTTTASATTTTTTAAATTTTTSAGTTTTTTAAGTTTTTTAAALCNLTTLRGTPTYVAGKFDNGISAGVLTSGLATLPDGCLSSTGADGGALDTGTVEFWAYQTATSSLRVLVGHDSWYWIGVNGSGQLQTEVGHWGAGESACTPTAFTTGVWHHVALVFNAGQACVYLDGVKLAGETSGWTTAASSSGFTIGGFGSGGDATSFDIAGGGGFIVDEVRISSTARYSSTFTPPATAFVTDAATTAIYRLESSGVNSA